MARNRSVDFLPEVFKTDTNKEFLSSTLDQLTQQPKLKQTQGYVGRKYGHGIKSDDSYVLEPNKERDSYQLEPGIVFKDGNNNANEVITYPELIDVLRTHGADVSNHARLFSSTIYSWNPLIDFDKFINHSQYYWLPSGTDSVDVSASDIMLTDNFDVSMGANSTYELSGISGLNPTITLVRGGEYTFTTSQAGHNFYIQTSPGISGESLHASNISSRDIMGVTNNGDDNGVITFAVPEANSQQFYYDLGVLPNIDLATLSRFDSINGKLVSELKNIDGIVDMDGKTIVFLDTTSGDSADLGWQYLDLHEDSPFESGPFEKTTFIDSQSDRYSVYRINYTTVGDESIIKLSKIDSIAKHKKFKIEYGTTYSNKSFYKNSSGFFEEIPLLTATHNVLYYQDSVDSTRFGLINIIDSSNEPELTIDSIVGKVSYVSPNGVEFTNGIKVIFRGNVSPIEYRDNEYYVEGVGTAIVLIKASDLITPETFHSSTLEPFDSHGYDSTRYDSDLNSPTTMDFITVNKSSNDLNPWSRSNRWVHIDVIRKSAEYNKTDAVIDNTYRANRPIIEFNANLRLHNFGTESKEPITIIDFVETDAFSNIIGSTTYSVDSFNLTDGNRIVFAKDSDINVKNKIFVVKFVDVLGDGVLRIDLEEASDGIVLVDQNLVCTNGLTLQGKAFHFNGSEWILSQQKTGVNTPPYFDVFDSNGFSYSDETVYPYTTFSGTKMFGYAKGTGVNRSVLGFPLKYLNIDNVGDIVFYNNLYKDTFDYNFTTTTKNISDGFVRKHTSRTAYTKEVGWTEFVHDTTQAQIFNFEYDGVSLILDVIPKENLSTPSIKVFKDSEFINSSEYTVTTTDKTIITFNNDVAISTEFVVSIISDNNSSIGYYEIPKNLESNPLNENSTSLTLGTIRNHCNNLSQNLLSLTGEFNGSNNSRDLGNIAKYGDSIIQNSSPVAPMAKFLHSKEFDFFKSIEFNANSYEKFKLKLLKYVIDNDTYGLSASDVLDNALQFINIGKSTASAFYKSDMLGGASNPSKTTHTVSSISTNTFNTSAIYDFTKANNASILVYLNNSILTKGVDYSVSGSGATINVIKTLITDDVITIVEYETTVGSYVPNTPTKMGLYPKFQPKLFNDDTAITPTNVIQGHDGSITVAFGDFRDDVLLEFEKRIFNNIKIDSKIPILDVDIIPGKFRTTDYTDAETTNILSNSFLNWVGYNRLDYKTQDFLADNESTWNYSTCSSKLDNTPLKGHWRGVYRDYYDTDTPHTTPWHMIGFSEKPSWWEDEYGVVPYTSGNMVLWDDLESGLIKEPGNNRVDIRYKRTGLTSVIPVDSSGKLVNPFVSVVQNYSQRDFRKSWVIGDCGPVENTWRRSSSYPFAMQRLFSLTKPAQYYSLNIDRDRYTYDDDMNQYMYDSRYKLDVRTVEIQTNTLSKHSYVNWITDYHNNNGCSCLDITDQLKEVDVRLCYRMAAFTDKNYLKIYTDKSSPNSTNTGLLLPDQSYSLLLHKNEPISELQYSSVIVQLTEDGYSVHGNSSSQQYFEILRSVANSNNDVVSGLNIPKDFTSDVTYVPYGYVFTNKHSLVDFLVSYGALLESRGLVFESRENNKTLNWRNIVGEFIAWDSQEWGVGSIINLNPGAIELVFNKELAIVDDISKSIDQILDQNKIPFEPIDYVITRLDNSFKIRALNGKSINFIKLKTTSYEHLLVLDNESIFNDLLYQPLIGLRQQRIRLVGFTTFDWNGQLDAQGFILNQDNVGKWEANKFYTTGNIVKFKNLHWSAVSKLTPTTAFNFDDWVEIDYDDIKKGLLPNISNKAGQISDYYNKKTANLESDVDLLAMGLVGFRPRTYLNSLDDVSQVNFYTDFVSNKGTNRSASVFNNVNFNKKITNYSIFENWAVLESSYGGSNNNAYIDVVLSDSKSQSNPVIAEVINDGSTTNATHNLIELSDIYKQSKIHTNTDIYPTIDKKGGVKLPTAGNIALFELSDFNGASGVPFISDLISGSTVWVAKDSAYGWDVYRADINSNIKSIISVDGVISITFYLTHDFVVGDVMVIQGMNLVVNGGYLISDVVDSSTVRVSSTVSDAYVNISSDSSITTDTVLYTADHKFGFVYKLSSVRIDDMDGFDSSYIHGLPIGSRVWVDSNRDGKSATYKKYNNISDITSDEIDITSDDSVYTSDGYGVWAIVREEQDKVNVDLINRISLYSNDTNETKTDLDFIDPLNGKHLGTVDENINYVGAINPASYNSSTNAIGVMWGETHVGEIWWDTSNIRFLDYNQKEISYSSKNWGGLFPGSTVDIRQWVKSASHPSQYNGEGTVVNESEFTIVSNIDAANSIVQNYYFWIHQSDAITEDKKLSINSISQYIANPMTSGVMYASFLNNSTVAIYNSQSEFKRADSVMHISYKQSYDETPIFNEYNLIKEGKESDFLSNMVYQKLQDSFVGGNTLGLSVPDITLGVAERMGLGIRPRQTMFANRLNALQTYLTEVNGILKQHIISFNKSFDLLTKAEVAPTKLNGEWDFNVANLTELYHQDTTIVGDDYKYLVTQDTDHNGGWSIYDVQNSKLRLIRVQKYDTTRAWSYINWYSDTDAENAIPQYTISDASKLVTLNVEDGSYVKVLTNSIGKFEIYKMDESLWTRVGLEDGTIEINKDLWSGKSSHDSITVDTLLFASDSYINTADEGTGGVELRNVIRAINEEILVDDLETEKNTLLISVFRYILSEQSDVSWLQKTSQIDVEHTVRDLEQYPTFKKDDQDFLLNYLMESKPYHTTIKDFLLKYNGNDQYNVDSSDFDVPTYFDESFGKFISPILDYDGVVLKSDQSNFDDDGVGLKENDYNIWKLSPWDNWYNNRGLEVSTVLVSNGGSGYTSTPTITVVGNATTIATMDARINSLGEIVGIDVINGGSGYLDIPTIELSDGGGNGAILMPIMSNPLVRTITPTLRYDRCSYNTSVVDWVNDMSLSTVDSFMTTADDTTNIVDSDLYEKGKLVRFKNKLYVLNVSKIFESTFDIGDFTEIDSSTLEYVYDNTDNAYVSPIPSALPSPRYEEVITVGGVDRTMGYYVSDVDNNGLNINLLIDGTTYGGVVIDGIPLEGSDGDVDVDYSSAFTDSYLGTSPSDINPDGGGFVDLYSSHSPEELIPGSVFDTLDMVVNTRPGFDYDGNGHSFEMNNQIFDYTATDTEFNFSSIVEHPISISVVNITRGLVLINGVDYTIDWVNNKVSVIDNASDGDSIQIHGYEVGGGNQLYRGIHNGADVVNQVTIPVESGSIYNILIHINGVRLLNGFTSTTDGKVTVDSILETTDSNVISVDTVNSDTSNTTTITFSNNYTSSDFIAISVFGFESTQHEFSYPMTKNFVGNAMTYDLTSGSDGISVSNKNRQNALVYVDGIRLRPPEASRYIGDGAGTSYRLPIVGGVDHSLVADAEIIVYIGNELQTLGIEYLVVTVVESGTTFKNISFGGIAPSANEVIDVYITSSSDYEISGNNLVISPSISVTPTSNISVTTWNDTSEMDVLTSVFKGPSHTSALNVELYDSFGFDVELYDSFGNTNDTVNIFELGRTIMDGNRLIVTRNGKTLLYGVSYVVIDSSLLISGEVISPSDIISVTSTTDGVVPEALSFRIFKDMNGSSAMYKVNNSVILKNTVSETDDKIYITNIDTLTKPNLELGIFGIVIINGERITYRELNSDENYISGLRRGTAGTGIVTNHAVGDIINDVGKGTNVPFSTITSTSFGSDTTDAAKENDSIWYARGIGTVSNGVALQDQITKQALFVKK